MKKMWILFVACFLSVSAFADFDEVINDPSFYISETNDSYEGLSILIDGSHVTIDGAHSFSSLYLTNSAVITHETGNTNGLQLTVSNTLYISTNSSINANGKGSDVFTGQKVSHQDAAGSYGGRGGANGATTISGPVYGDFRAPIELGSAGESSHRGGGAIRIIVDQIILDGKITAVGSSGWYTGAGSGGSIWLTATNLSGGGRLSSNGGFGSRGASGGGGRVAVYYAQANNFNFSDQISCTGGAADSQTVGGGPGSIYLKEANLSNGVLIIDGKLANPDSQQDAGYEMAGTVLDEVVVLNSVLVLTNASAFPAFTGSNSVVVQNGLLDTGTGSNIVVDGWTWECNFAQDWNNITVTNGGKITHEVGNTNGLQLTVSNTLYISTNSSVDVSGCGLPFSGSGDCGGSYGGLGGRGNSGDIPNSSYGNYLEPVELGRAGCQGNSKGGGAAAISAETIWLDGDILANGVTLGDYSGGGSGGSIWINANTLKGGGILSAGGSGGRRGYASVGYGGGGGGRIAVYYSQFEGFNPLTQISCTGGPPDHQAVEYGDPGSIYVVGADVQVNVPVVTNFSSTAINNITETNPGLEGTKGINTSVWADWQEIATNDASTDWSRTLQLTLTQGVNQVLVYARDADGNCSDVTELDFFVDSIAPTADTMVPSDSINYSFASITLDYTETGSGLDPNATLNSLTVFGEKDGVSSSVYGDWAVASNQLVFTPQSTPLEGVYTVSGMLYDEIGLGTAFTNSFTVTFGVPLAPTVDTFDPTTEVSVIAFTGDKPAETEFYMNGALVPGFYSSARWSKTEHLDAGLNSYTCSVQNVAGTFSPDTPFSVTYTDVDPGPVIDLTAITNGIGTEISLLWTNYDEYANGADISNYVTYQATNSFTVTTQATAIATNNAGIQSALVTGLVRSVTNWYAVVPVDATGQQQTNSLTSFGFAPNDIVAPLNSTPITFDCSTTGLVLHWPHIDDIHSDFSNYLVYVTNNPVAVETTNNIYTLNGLASSSNYHFKVSSVDETGNENTNGTEAVGYTLIGENPTNVVVTDVYSGRITLQWDAVIPSGNVKHYAVYSSTSDFSNVEGMTPRITTANANCGVAGLVNDVINYFAVTAVNQSDGELKDVTTVSATPLPDTVGPVLSGLKWDGSAVGTLSAPGTFSITASDPAGMSRVEFRIGTELIGTQSGSGPSYSAFWNVAAMPGDGTYDLLITAYDSLNNSSDLTTNVTIALALPLAPTISAPANGSSFNYTNVTFSGMADSYADNVIFSNFAGSAVVGSGGSFSKTLTLQEGTNQVFAGAVNRAGTTWSSAHTIIVNTAVPDAPFNVKAQSRADGMIKLSWWAPQGVSVKNYTIYRSENSFSNTAQSTWSTSTTSRTYYDLPPVETSYYYRVSTINMADTESALSSEVSAMSDGTPPVVTISYASTGQSETRSGTNTFAAGTVSVEVITDEKLAAVPFCSMRPTDGLPVLIDLRKQNDTNYTGSFEITESMDSGPADIFLTCRDDAGNITYPTNAIIVDTDGPALSGLFTEPGSPIRNTNGTDVTVFFTFEGGEEPVGGFDFGYKLSVSQTNVTPVSLTQWLSSAGRTGTFALPEEAGSNQVEELIFVLSDAIDTLGNSNTMSVSAAQVYQGELEPLEVPTDFAGVALPDGVIQLTWNSVEDAADYHLFHGTNSAVITNNLGMTGITNVYTNTFNDGVNWFGLRTVRSANGQTPESAQTNISVIADSIAPTAPTNLTIDLAGNGMHLIWELSDPDTATCALYRSTEEATNYTRIVTDIPGTNVVDPNPLQNLAYYRVTALDATDNESALSASISYNVSLLPVNSLTVTRTESGWPVVSWTHANPSALDGYNLYLNNATNSENTAIIPVSEASFTDYGYDLLDVRRYEVRAHDSSPDESKGRVIDLPLLTAFSDPDNTLDRGVMNRLSYIVQNDGTQAVSNVRMQADVNGTNHLSETFTVPALGTTNVSLAVGGYEELPYTVTVTNTVLLTPNAGEEVRIVDTEDYDVGTDVLNVEMLTTNFTRGASGSVQFVLRNTCSERIEVLMAENNGNAISPDVRFKLLDENGDLYAAQAVQQGGENVTARPNGGMVAELEPGASFTSAPVQIDVPSGAPDILTVKMEIDHVYYDYGRENPIRIKGVSTTREVNLLETPYYATVTNITPAVAVGTNTTLSGQIIDRSNETPLGNQPLKLVLGRDGFERSFDLYSDEDGNWEYTFAPAAGESGTFRASALHPAMTERPEHGTFEVRNVKITPLYQRLNIPRNYTKTLYASVTPGTGLALTHLTVAFAAEDQENSILPEGITVTPHAPIAIVDGGSTVQIGCDIKADTHALDEMELVLRVQSDEAVWGTISIAAKFGAEVVEEPHIEWTPSIFETGVAISNRISEETVFKNIGYAPVLDAVLTLAPVGGGDLPTWVVLNSATNFGEIAIGDEYRVGVMFAPTNGVATGWHEFDLSLTGSHYTNTQTLRVNVDNSGTGGAVFKVEDIYTGWGSAASNENYYGLGNTRIQLIREGSEIIPFITNLVTVSDESPSTGLANVSDLPIGRYRVRVSAAGHEDLSDRIWIKPGAVVSRQYMMNSRLVTVEWNVREIEIEDRYDIVLNATYKTDVPAPVLIMEPLSVTLPDMNAGDVFTGEFTIKNHGLIRAENIVLNLPAADHYLKYEWMSELPDTLDAQQTIAGAYRITCLSDLSGDEEEGGGGTCWASSGCSAGWSKSECANGVIVTNHFPGTCWRGGPGSCDPGDDPYYENGPYPDMPSKGSPTPPPAKVPGSPGSGGCTPGAPPCDGPCCPSAAGGAGGSGGGGNGPASGGSHSNHNPTERYIGVGASVVDLVAGRFEEGLVDLSIKIPGSHISIMRLYRDDHWIFNHPWSSITHHEIYTANGGGSGRSPSYVERNGLTYECLNAYGTHYGYPMADEQGNTTYPYTITETDAGWQWRNKYGEWINYNTGGDILSYGDLQRTHALMSYNNNVMTGVMDAQSNQLFWISYTNDLISSVRDEMNRTVQYSYSTNGLLTNVVDVTGNETTYGYDSEGRMDFIREPNGDEHAIARYDNGHVRSVLNAAGQGRLFEYNYDAVREEYYALEERTDGILIERWYDGNDGSLLKRLRNGTMEFDSAEEEDDLYEPKVEKDGWGNIIKITYTDGAEATHEYIGITVDGTRISKLAKDISETGITNLYQHDAKANLTNEILYAGTAFEQNILYEYDEIGQLLSRSEGLASSPNEPRITEYLYDERGNTVSVTAPDGTITTNTYNLLGNVLTSGVITENSELFTLSSNTFDAAGNLLTSARLTDNGYQTTVSNAYNSVGNRVISRDVTGRPTTYDYDLNGRMIAITNWLGEVTTRTYDFEGSLLAEIKTTEDGEQRTDYTYDDQGNLLTQTLITDNQSLITSYSYDLDNRLIKSTDSSGNITETTYNDPGLVETETRITDNRSRITEYCYDLRGRVLSQTVSTLTGSTVLTTLTTSYSYDAYGNISSVTDPMSRETGTEHDLLGRVTAVTDALGNTNQFAYNAWGSLTNLTDANGNETAFEYDEAGRLTQKTYDDNTFHEYFYDDLGHLETAIDAKEQMITYEYDLLGQLRTNFFFATTNALTPDKTVVYTYDEYGRILVSDLRSLTSTNTYVFAYDDTNRTRTVTVDFGSFSKSYTYEYDSDSRKLAFIRGSFTNSYSYDAQGRLESIGIPNEGVVTYNYNAVGLPSGITLPGGTEKRFGYDALSALATNTVRDAAANEVMNREYIRNAMQNITGIVEDDSDQLIVKSYQYDRTDQLTNETVSADSVPLRENSFVYDSMGNRTTEYTDDTEWVGSLTYDPNNLNQYLSVTSASSAVSFSYDLNGNTTQKVSVASGVTSVVNYAYSIDNRLTEVVISKASSLKTKALYQYDPFGRRVNKKVYAWESDLWSLTSDIWYLYADEGLVGEFDENGDEIRSYCWKPNSLWMNDPVCMTVPSKGTFYYLNDHLGAPQRMVDESGALVWSMTSEAFGKATVSTNSTINNNLRFSSQYYDEETGLQYNYFRYYDTEAGRYLRRDPLLERGGINLYGFVRNNPLYLFDLLGLRPKRPPKPIERPDDYWEKELTGYAKCIRDSELAYRKGWTKCLLKPFCVNLCMWKEYTKRTSRDTECLSRTVTEPGFM